MTYNFIYLYILTNKTLIRIDILDFKEMVMNKEKGSGEEHYPSPSSCHSGPFECLIILDNLIPSSIPVKVFRNTGLEICLDSDLRYFYLKNYLRCPTLYEAWERNIVINEKIVFEYYQIYVAINLCYFRTQMTNFIKEVRANKNGSLTGLSFDDIVACVTQLVNVRQNKVGLTCAIISNTITSESRGKNCGFHKPF